MRKATRASNNRLLMHAISTQAFHQGPSTYRSIFLLDRGKGFVGELKGEADSLRRVFDFVCDLLTHLLFGNREVIARLQIHPKLRAVAKIARQT